MLQLRIGIQLASLRQPFRKALETASQLGAQGIEIDARHDVVPKEMTRTAIRHLRKMLDDRNLRVCAVHFPTRRGYNVLDQLDQRVEATKEAMNLAYDLGAPIVSNQIGQIPEDRKDPTWGLLMEALSDLGRHGQRCGALLAARTGAEDGATLKGLIDALPLGSLVVDFDPGELIVHRHSPAEAITLLAEHVRHVRARDAVQDLAQGRGLEVQLGRGSVDFPTLLGTLENYDYGGFLTLERRRAEHPVVELEQGVQYLHALFN